MIQKSYLYLVLQVAGFLLLCNGEFTKDVLLTFFYTFNGCKSYNIMCMLQGLTF